MSIEIKGNTLSVTVEPSHSAVTSAARVLPKRVMSQLHPEAPYRNSYELINVPKQEGIQNAIEKRINSMSYVLERLIMRARMYVTLVCLLITVSASAVIVNATNPLVTVTAVAALTCYIVATVLLYRRQVEVWKGAIEGLRFHFLKEFSRHTAAELKSLMDAVNSYDEDITRYFDRNNEAVKKHQFLSEKLNEVINVNDKITDRLSELEMIEQSRDGILYLYQDLLNNVPVKLVNKHIERCRTAGIEFDIVEDEAEYHGVGTMSIQ